MRRGVFLVLVLQASVSCRLPPPAAPGRAGMEVGGADVPYNRALTAWNSGRRAAAREELSRAIELEPGYAMAYAGRCMVTAFTESLAAALPDCDRAVALAPLSPSVHAERGRAKMRRAEELPGALGDLTRAIELKPDFARAYTLRAVVYVRTGDLDRARSDCERSVTLAPEYAQALCNCGYVYNGLHIWKQAIAAFTRGIRLNPKLAYCHRGRAHAYVMTDERERASADLERAGELERKHGAR